MPLFCLPVSGFWRRGRERSEKGGRIVVGSHVMVWTLWISSVCAGLGGLMIIGTARNILGEINGGIFIIVSAVLYSAAVIVRAIERRGP